MKQIESCLAPEQLDLESAGFCGARASAEATGAKTAGRKASAREGQRGVTVGETTEPCRGGRLVKRLIVNSSAR